jgi:hypothetical protein
MNDQTQPTHPLLAILPTVKAACEDWDVAPPRVLRTLGQPHTIELTSRCGRTIEIVLHEDTPKHRRDNSEYGLWVETDALSLEDEICDDDDGDSDDDDGEFAMQQGMAFGIDAYNEARGCHVGEPDSSKPDDDEWDRS